MVIDVMPASAALRVWTELLIESSSDVSEVARLLKPWAVKKLVALSRAELTVLPVASRFWVVAISWAVSCSESRF